MYKKSSSGWLKHYDFIILDLLCLQLAFILANVARHGFHNPYQNELYCSMAVFVMVADMAVIFFYETFSGVLKRGYYKEFTKTVKHSALVEGCAVIFLFSAKEGENYSRLALYLMWLFYVIFSYGVRIFWKFHLRHGRTSEQKNSLLIVTSTGVAEEVVKNIRDEETIAYTISGIVILDADWKGKFILGFPVVSDAQGCATYVCRHWVDEVLINPAPGGSYPQEMVDNLTETGVTVHENLAKLSETRGRKQLVEKIGDYTVLTTSINNVSQKQAFMKRGLDIAGGMVGCLLTGILALVLGPAIYFASPGPIFFSQTRVGKNGKKFKIYKFRSMYMDAEERKKELMEQNRVQDGMMFKMEFDPRIIGNRILPDGTQKTGIGDFIRRTSMDEFPQFWNVLKGDMSLVGTRPPTLDEWEKYELHHRARLAIKPGITGLWQVSGRSKITDFEEVVKLDTQYINEWSMGMDLRILCKTVLALVKRDGAM